MEVRNEEREKQKELQCTKLWLKASEERREQVQKVKQRKLKGSEAASMFIRSEDVEHFHLRIEKDFC